MKDGYLLYGNELCVAQGLHHKVMFETHAPPYEGPTRVLATLEGAEMYFYWPTMKTGLQGYVNSCMVCQKTKYDRGKTLDMPQPLLILDRPSKNISMDFFSRLPKPFYGNTRIWMIVRCFSK